MQLQSPSNTNYGALEDRNHEAESTNGWVRVVICQSGRPARAVDGQRGTRSIFLGPAEAQAVSRLPSQDLFLVGGKVDLIRGQFFILVLLMRCAKP